MSEEILKVLPFTIRQATCMRALLTKGMDKEILKRVVLTAATMEMVGHLSHSIKSLELEGDYFINLELSAFIMRADE